MSFFDFFSDSDEEVGNEVLKAYYDEAYKFSDFNHATYEAWVNWLNSKVPGFVADTGALVKMNSASTSVEDSQDRMIYLANKSGGKANVAAITMAAGGNGSTVNWSAAIPDVASETAKDILAVVQTVGDGSLATVKLLKYMPWILGGAGALYIVFLAKGTGRSVGRSIEKLSGAASERLSRKNPRRKKRRK